MPKTKQTDPKVCPNCQKMFTNGRNLRTHIDICMHGNRKALMCSICERRYSHQTTLIKHKKECLARAMADTSAVYTNDLNLTLIDRGRYDVIKLKKTELKTSFHDYFDLNYLREPKHYVLYLLMDPRQLIKQGDELELWRSFISAIFYVGIELAYRPLTHLATAIDVYHGNMSTTVENNEESLKVKKIIDIWNSGHGIVMPQFCWFTGHNEAQTLAACIIQALRIDNLVNQSKGTMYGPPAAGEWTDTLITKFGIQNLHTIFQELNLEEGRFTELYVEDIMDVEEVEVLNEAESQDIE